jgi:hypothetical protein
MASHTDPSLGAERDASRVDDDDALAAPVRLRHAGTLLLFACLVLELWIAYRPPRWLLVEFEEAAATGSSNGHGVADRVAAYTAPDG